MNNENINQKKGIISLIILDIVGASMGIFARILEKNLLLFQQVAFRLFSGFIIINILFYKNIDYSKLKKIPVKDWIILVFRSVCMYLLGITLGTVAFINGKYSNVSFIMALPMTAVLGILILRENINFQKGILILISFSGVILISIGDFSNIFKWDKSSIIALISITFVSLSNILRKYHTDLLNDREITALILLISTLLLFCTSLITGENLSNINWNLELLIIIIFAGLFNGVYMLMANYGFNKVDAILANNILAVQSIFGLGVGYILYKETTNIRELIGGILIIVSIILFNKVNRK